MQFKILSTSTEMQAVQQQEATILRRIKLSETTEKQINELTQNKPDTTVWKGVGKMFLSTTVADQIQDLEKERKEYQEQLSALKKKQNYLENTYKNLTSAFQNISVGK